MIATEEVRDCRISGITRISVKFWAVVLALSFALGLCAQAQAQNLLKIPGKGLYYLGKSHFLYYDPYDMNSMLGYSGGIWLDEYEYFEQELSHTWDFLEISGSLGGCIFNGAIYGFFTTDDGKLQYVTVSPSTGAATGPTTIATGISAKGAAAAVLGDGIYIFTASRTFRSADGKNFAVDSSGPPPQAGEMLDAVNFFQPGNDPAGIMVVYLDGNSNPLSSVFTEDTAFSTPQTLPYPFDLSLSMGNLVLGSSDSLPEPGAKALCLQFYGISQVSQPFFGYNGYAARWEYNLTNKTWTIYDMSPTSGIAYTWVMVAPWFETADQTKGTLRLHHLLSLGRTGGLGSVYYYNTSDYMIPQHNDPTYGWQGVPTKTSSATSDDDKSKKLRNLWSLVGIVLGPPPFALNGADDAGGLSSVQYGIDHSTSVTTTQTSTSTISVGTETQIQGGLGEANFDFSYAHGWTSSQGKTNTVEVATYYEFGPLDETPPDQGIHGWAIFNAPVLLTQQFKRYAYDQSTYLGQNMYTTSTGSIVQQVENFLLDDPSDGSIQGLLEGMQTYPDSTDLAHWLNIYNWNDGDNDWTVKFGDLSNPPVGTLNQGVATTQQYTQTDSTTDSQGNTNSFSVEAGASFDIFEGFSEGITVSYDTEFETSTEIQSTITKSVSCSLNMPIPSKDADISNLLIQPYWLQATTDQAPWIPKGYSGNMPWCITWNVIGYNTLGTDAAGTAVPPDSTTGTIRKAMVGADTYEVYGGHLTWRNDQGVEIPLSMTADEFIPVKGVVVSLNGHSFSTRMPLGRWIRQGDVWTYRTRRGVKTDPFVLKLDFANKTWSFKAQSSNLEEVILLADGSLRVELDLQGSYRFANWLKHDVDATWQHKEEKAAWYRYGVDEIIGALQSQTDADGSYLLVSGHIPKFESRFGDVEILVNGVSISIPLLTTEGFIDTLDQGGVAWYETDGLFFQVDFSEGTWKLRIENESFLDKMAPDGGQLRLQFLVGGEPVSDQTMEVAQHEMALSFGG